MDTGRNNAPEPQELPIPATEGENALQLQVRQAMAAIVRGMQDIQAEFMRVSTELAAMSREMTELRRAVRTLTKITPAQAKSLNAAISARAAALCADYGLAGHEKAVANAIRRAVKMTTGIQSMRELPRDEYSVALDQIEMWDDYKTMKSIQTRMREGCK